MIQHVPIDNLRRGEGVVVTMTDGRVFEGCYIGMYRTVSGHWLRIDCGYYAVSFPVSRIESIDRASVELDPC